MWNARNMGLSISSFHMPSLKTTRSCRSFQGCRIGTPSSPVLIRCDIEGAVPLPRNIPTIGWRRGLDIDPIDLHDPERVIWLLACVWPDHNERRQRLQAAISLCRNDPPPMMRGDLIDDLPALIREAPSDCEKNKKDKAPRKWNSIDSSDKESHVGTAPADSERIRRRILISLRAILKNDAEVRIPRDR